MRPIRYPKLIDKLHALLPPVGRHLLSLIQTHSAELHQTLYLVGGPVRDLLLRRPSVDLDIAVEGDGIALARRLAKQTGSRLRVHPTFLTASVRLDGFVLDIATARFETYARPGALPTVSTASIQEDLLRRDFTINAMALRLNDPGAGELIDPVDGRADLSARLVRTLHDRSFQDDPTRTLRAFRYASRLGFAIETQTLRRLKRDLRYVDTVGGARLYHEFAHILAEDAPEETLFALQNNGVLAAVYPKLRFERPQLLAFARLRRLNPTGARASYWPLLGWHLEPPDATSLTTRLALTNLQRAAIEAMPPLSELVAQHLQVRRPKRSVLVDLLSPFPLAAIWALAALAAGAAREQLLDYLTKARHVRPLLRGDDVIALGVPDGPRVGDMLRRLRAAKLNGEVQSRQDEEKVVRRLPAKHPTRASQDASSRSS